LSNLQGLAIALLFLKDFHGAREAYLRALGRDDLAPMARATLQNNLAWTDLMIGGGDLLDEADRFSCEAMELGVTAAWLKGTRGSVLIERGSVDQGLAQVREAFEGNTDHASKP
jgi:hypothetical protein